MTQMLTHRSSDGRFEVVEYFGDRIAGFDIVRDGRKTAAKRILYDENRHFGQFITRGDRGSFRNHFGLITQAGTDPCFAVWFRGRTNWQAWFLQTGAEVAEAAMFQANWEKHAEALAERRVLELEAKVRAGTGINGNMIFDHGNSLETCYKFLTRRKTDEARRMLTISQVDPAFLI